MGKKVRNEQSVPHLMSSSGALMVNLRSRHPFPEDRLSLKVFFLEFTYQVPDICLKLPYLAHPDCSAVERPGCKGPVQGQPSSPQDGDMCRRSGRQMRKSQWQWQAAIPKQEQPSSRRIRGSSEYVFTGSFSQPQESGQEEAQKTWRHKYIKTAVPTPEWRLHNGKDFYALQ